MTFDGRARGLLWAAVILAGLGGFALLLRPGDDPSPSLSASTSTTSRPSGSTTLPDVDRPGDPGRVALPGFAEVAVSVQPPEGDLLSWCLLAALTVEQRARGLMEVTDLQGYEGMAFLYDEPSDGAFYMRNTPMPLSIAWIDRSGRIVSTADMEPCEDRDGCPTYGPAGPYIAAIEVPQGRLDDLGIVEGATVSIGGACAPIR